MQFDELYAFAFVENAQTKKRKENISENKSVFTVKQKWVYNYVTIHNKIANAIRALEVLELFFRFKFYVKLQVHMSFSNTYDILIQINGYL